MSTILASLYRKVITGKYAATCTACGDAVAAGTGYAAVDDDGWHNFCATCAAGAGPLAQRLAVRANALSATATNLSEAYTPSSADVLATIAGTSPNPLPTLRALLILVAWLVDGQPKVEDPRITALRATNPTSDFALSLLAQYDRKGSLSDKQWPHVEKLAGAPGGKPAGLAPGIYCNAAGVFVKVQSNKAGTGTYTKVWTGGGWEYEPALKGDTSLRPITAEEAARWGHEHHRCVFCSTPLTDDGDNRSVQVGYGPICAAKYGLPWG